jgi:TRAP-type transport system periplasmic protein
MRTSRRLAAACLAIALAFAVVSSAQAAPETVSIKIVSIMPDSAGLPWVSGIKKIAVEWMKLTKGQVVLSIETINDMSDSAIAQKVKAKVYDGVIFDQVGLIALDPNVIGFSTPSLIKTDEELNYVLSQAKDDVNASFDKRELKLVAWTKLGWLRFFSKTPFKTPEDLKRQKLATDNEQNDLARAFGAYGYKTVALSVSDYSRGLSTGLVDAYYSTPLLASTNGWYKKGNYMLDYKVSPLIGGMLFTKEAWERIPSQYRKPLMDIVNRLEIDINSAVDKAESQAIDAMTKYGSPKLVIGATSEAERAKWSADFDKVTPGILGSVMPREIYDIVLNKLNKGFRGK